MNRRTFLKYVATTPLITIPVYSNTKPTLPNSIADDDQPQYFRWLNLHEHMPQKNQDIILLEYDNLYKEPQKVRKLFMVRLEDTEKSYLTSTHTPKYRNIMFYKFRMKFAYTEHDIDDFSILTVYSIMGKEKYDWTRPNTQKQWTNADNKLIITTKNYNPNIWWIPTKNVKDMPPFPKPIEEEKHYYYMKFKDRVPHDGDKIIVKTKYRNTYEGVFKRPYPSKYGHLVRITDDVIMVDGTLYTEGNKYPHRTINSEWEWKYV